MKTIEIVTTYGYREALLDVIHDYEGDLSQLVNYIHKMPCDDDPRRMADWLNCTLIGPNAPSIDIRHFAVSIEAFTHDVGAQYVAYDVELIGSTLYDPIGIDFAMEDYCSKNRSYFVGGRMLLSLEEMFDHPKISEIEYSLIFHYIGNVLARALRQINPSVILNTRDGRADKRFIFWGIKGAEDLMAVVIPNQLIFRNSTESLEDFYRKYS